MVDFNVRGGRKLRKSYSKIKKAKVSKYMCPTCSKKSIKRVKIGMWECISCGSKYAGGAYEFSTAPGNVARRIISDLNKGVKNEMNVEQIEEELFEETPEPEDEDSEEEVTEIEMDEEDEEIKE
jgi:large subunit ribosomal protein L37Ae